MDARLILQAMRLHIQKMQCLMEIMPVVVGTENGSLFPMSTMNKYWFKMLMMKRSLPDVIHVLAVQ